MRRGNINRRAAVLAAAVAASISFDASAATHTFTPVNGTGNWSAGAAAGWDTLPISAANTTLVFGAGAIPDGSTSNTNNDIGNPFLANIMTLGGTGTATPSTINITGNPIQLL